LAVVLACATFPLIWVGGLVTTYDAGMAVPDWPSTFGYNLFLYPLSTWLGGPWDLFIEHGHRLLAAAVGLITVALVIVTWYSDRRRWVPWYMVGCLALVIGQGVLGGMRVLWDETLLARIHGCVGPLFFVASVVAATITSSWWAAAVPTSAAGPTAAFNRLAWFTAAVAYGQLVLGAHLRHVPFSWSPSMFRGLVVAHLFVAAVLTGHVVALLAKALRHEQIRGCRWLLRPSCLLSALIVCQLVLGAGAWRVKYDWPEWLPQPQWLRAYAVTAEGMLQTLVVTAHAALGSLILATTVLLAVRGSRLFPAAISHCSLAARSRRLEVLV
jgi:cytochrome c oxidase assembly protein subunit 15